MVLLGTEDARLGLAAVEDPQMRVSWTRTAENGAGKSVSGRGFGGFLSKKNWEWLHFLWEAECGFGVDLLKNSLGDLIHAVGAAVPLAVERKALKGHNERWSPFGYQCFWVHK